MSKSNTINLIKKLSPAFLALFVGLFLLCLLPVSARADEPVVEFPTTVAEDSVTENLPPVTNTADVSTSVNVPDSFASSSDPSFLEAVITPSTVVATDTDMIGNTNSTSTEITLEQKAALESISSTLSDIQILLAISDESLFTTAGAEENPVSVGAEDTFQTIAEGVEEIQLSNERSFSTLVSNLEMAISEENQFETVVGSCGPTGVSCEESFSTQISPVTYPTVSAEKYFNTQPQVQIITSISAEKSFVTVAVANPSVSSESSFDTLTSGPTVSSERTFTTLNSIAPPAISAEGQFTTKDTIIVPPNPSVSNESSFVTVGNLTVSNQYSFVTSPSIDHPETVSDENSFETLANNVPGVSAESSFTTNTSPITPAGVSEEVSFTTLGGGNINPVSEESSFTTNSKGGGGGGGGGGVISLSTTTPTVNVTECRPYLLKFIRYGQNNDRAEVIKLQLFLKIFEGYNVPISGFYDLKTMHAVEDFQHRYLRDVLKPWGITDSTGYVYITTTYAINNIFCGLDTANSFNLRTKVYQEYERYTGEVLVGQPGPVATTSVVISSSTISAITLPATTTSTFRNLLAAVGSLFGFIGDNFCWLLNLVLLLIILYLLWLLWQDGQDGSDSSESDGSLADEPNLTSSDQEFLNQMADEDDISQILGGATVATGGVIYLASPESISEMKEENKTDEQNVDEESKIAEQSILPGMENLAIKEETDEDPVLEKNIATEVLEEENEQQQELPIDLDNNISDSEVEKKIDEEKIN